MKTKFISLIVSVAVILGLMLVPAVAPPVLADPSNDWGIEIDPALSKVGNSEAFDVNVSVTRYDGDSAVYIYYVEFNGTLLNVTGVDLPDNLPNGFPPYEPLGPGTGSTWDNTSGWVRTAYTKAPGQPDISLGFTGATIHFTTLGVPGTHTTDLNFTCPTPLNCTFVGIGATNYLNLTKVVNGTVLIGAPELILNITPQYDLPTGLDPPTPRLFTWRREVWR